MDPAGEPSGPELRRLFFVSAYVLYGGGFLVTLLGAAIFSNHPLSYLPGPAGDVETWGRAAAWTGLGLSVGSAIVVLGYAASRLSKWLAELEKEFAAHLFWIEGWRDIFLLAILSAVGEEAFFRGLLQPHLGLLGSTAVFAICHPPLSRRLVTWPIFAFAIGLVLGYLFDRTGGNLLAPTAVHFAVNFLNMRLILRHVAKGDASGTGFATIEPPSRSTDTLHSGVEDHEDH